MYRVITKSFDIPHHYRMTATGARTLIKRFRALDITVIRVERRRETRKTVGVWETWVPGETLARVQRPIQAT